MLHSFIYASHLPLSLFAEFHEIYIKDYKTQCFRQKCGKIHWIMKMEAGFSKAFTTFHLIISTKVKYISRKIKEKYHNQQTGKRQTISLKKGSLNPLNNYLKSRISQAVKTKRAPTYFFLHFLICRFPGNLFRVIPSKT